jgi:hypothetical protein
MDKIMEKKSNKYVEFNIIVNSRDKQWFSEKISYNEVIVLAFGFEENKAITFYSVTYKKGDNNKPEGIIVAGDTVKVKNGMIFNVTATNKS